MKRGGRGALSYYGPEKINKKDVLLRIIHSILVMHYSAVVGLVFIIVIHGRHLYRQFYSVNIIFVYGSTAIVLYNNMDK